MADLSLHYRKTAAGAQELAAKQLGLSREQRNLLIVADGRHSLAVYCQAVGCNPGKLSALADELLALGLIESGSAAPVAAPAQAPAPAAAPSASAIPDIETLRRQVVDIAVAVFGAQLAQPVVARLDKAHASTGELVAAVEGAAKLAKLTIDEEKARGFLAEARRALGI
jgi:hypothetical protein